MGEDNPDVTTVMSALAAEAQTGKQASAQRFGGAGRGWPVARYSSLLSMFDSEERFLQALDRCREAGYPVSVSSGEFNRYVQTKGHI